MSLKPLYFHHCVHQMLLQWYWGPLYFLINDDTSSQFFPLQSLIGTILLQLDRRQLVHHFPIKAQKIILETFSLCK